MTFTISGFGREQSGKRESIPKNDTSQRTLAPRKSVVQVSFPGRGGALAYYNDQFDLKVGDRVYVEGKLEGQLGYVVAVNYNFKIKLSEYKRVIALVDTHVHGQFYIAGSHFLTFDPSVIPAAQVTTWFRAPTADNEEYASGSDGTSFRLDNLQEIHVSNAIAERGHNYYMENRVRYRCLNGAKGYASVEGTQPYTVEFEYENGEIRNLLCDCFCSYPCKHEVAAMLQLRESLAVIEDRYSEAYAQSGYFAAISKGTLFSFAIDGNDGGSFTL